MKSITVHGIDPETKARLREIARAQARSVNQVVLEAIRKAVGLESPEYKGIHNDLDQLFGKWSQTEFNRIHGAIKDQRKMA